MATNPMNSFLAGSQVVGGMEQAQTTALGNQLARETLRENDELKKWNADLEVLKGAGIVTEENNGNIVLNVDAVDKLGGLTKGNRTGVSNSLLMNEMMGQYHGEQDGKLIKKKNKQVFAPTPAKSGAVPKSIMEAAAAGDANAVELKKQYDIDPSKDNTLKTLAKLNGFVDEKGNPDVGALLNVYIPILQDREKN